MSMLIRVLNLVLVVLALALPHPGSRVMAMDGVTGHAAHLHHGGSGDPDPARTVHHGDPLCAVVCLGAPLAEEPAAKGPLARAVPLWAGIAKPLPPALAGPVVLVRPPDAIIPV